MACLPGERGSSALFFGARHVPRRNGLRKHVGAVASALLVFASSPQAATWIAYPAVRSEGAAHGRACTSTGAPPTTLIVDRDARGEPAALRLPGDMWATAIFLDAKRRRIVLEGQSIGMLERVDAGWRAELAGGDAECRFEGFRALFDAASRSDAPAEGVMQASLVLSERLRAAALARADGQTVAARRALSEFSPQTVPALRLRAYLHRARIEIEAGDVAAAEADLASAAALRNARAFTAPVADAFERSVSLRVALARGERERVIAERVALDADLASTPGAPSEDRIANRVYLAAAQIAQRRTPDAAATLDGWMSEVDAHFRPADPVRVDAVAAHALTERAAGRFAEAQDEVAALLREVARTSGTSNLAYAELATRYGLNAAVAQRPLEAVPALARAVTWFAAELGPDNARTRSAREFYAYALGLADRLPEAIAVQREVVATYAAATDATPSGNVTVRHTLANFLGRDERYGEAEALLAQLIAEAPATEVTRDRIAHLELDLAYVQWETRGADAACARVEQVRAAVDGGVALPVDLASEYDLLVARCVSRVSPQDGIARLRRIVTRQAELFGADSVGVVNAQAALARAQIDASDRVGARATLESLATMIERLRHIEAPDAIGARNAFAKWLKSDGQAAGYRDLGFIYARDAEVTRAIEVADAARARSLNDAIGLARDVAGLPSRDQIRAGALARHLREQDAEIALLAPADPTRIALEVARIDAAAELDTVMRGPAVVAQPRTDVLDLKAATARLPPGSAFVGLQVVRDGVWAYVARRDRAPAIIMLDRAVPLIRAITPLRIALATPQESRAPLWKTNGGAYVNALTPPEGGAQRIAVIELAADLGDALLAPLLPHLNGVDTLVVAADAPLNAVPLDALRLDGAPVAARFALQYAPSLGVWAARAAQAHSVAFRRDLVAIGAPDYAAMIAAAAGPLPARTWGPLPGATAELEAVARLFPRDRRVLAIGDEASKTRFAAYARDGTLASARYLHVAAHGLLAVDAPQWSSIVLGGGRDGAPVYLTAAEIATFDIRADLVVLSACETALGKDVAGEGLFGLPYAFAIAGARSTLLTLWPVADRPTAQFMRRYYARLARGISPGHALAQTKREFIRSKEYSAPFYWAPFVLYGT